MVFRETSVCRRASSVHQANEALRWSYGANRVQLDADLKILSEFLTLLQSDQFKGSGLITSMSPLAVSSRNKGSSSFCRIMQLIKYWQLRVDHVTALRSVNMLLRLLIENEMNRLSVWANPSNEPKRGADYTGVIERSMTDVAHWYFRY